MLDACDKWFNAMLGGCFSRESCPATNIHDWKSRVINNLDSISKTNMQSEYSIQQRV